MSAKDNEARILSSLSTEEPDADLDLIPGAAAITRLRAEIRALRPGLGLPALSPERAAALTTISRADDAAYYAAYTRALKRRPALAERTVSPSFFEHLARSGARMSALAAGATQLGEKLLLCSIDLAQSIADRNRRLGDLLSRPEDEPVTSALTVRHARALFSEFRKVSQDQERQAEARKAQADRPPPRARADRRPAQERAAPGPAAPRRDEDEHQLNAALALKAFADALKVQVRPGLHMNSEPKAANDRGEKARLCALSLDASNEASRAVLRALGIDPDPLRPDLTRHDELWAAYLDVKDLRRGARDGRRICDRLRQIAAAMVDTEAAALLDEAPDDPQRSALISDLRDIHLVKLGRVQDQQAAQQRLAKIEAAARDRAKDIKARTRLFQVMSAMRKGQDLPWDQILEAVQIYRDLYGEDLDDDAPPPQA